MSGPVVRAGPFLQVWLAFLGTRGGPLTVSRQAVHFHLLVHRADTAISGMSILAACRSGCPTRREKGWMFRHPRRADRSYVSHMMDTSVASQGKASGAFRRIHGANGWSHASRRIFILIHPCCGPRCGTVEALRHDRSHEHRDWRDACSTPPRAWPSRAILGINEFTTEARLKLLSVRSLREAEDIDVRSHCDGRSGRGCT